MANVFLSYRNTPERRAYVERLRLVLDAYGLSVWWDYGLAAGKDYEPQIMAELAAAGVIIPLWCEESIHSEWVAKEARFGLDHKKLLPARLQSVRPPDPFEPIQAQDLIGWDGSVESFQITTLAAAICSKLGATLTPAGDKLRAMRALAPLAPLSHARARGGVAGPAPAASPSAQAWAHIAASLDPRAYDDFLADYPGTLEVTLARKHKRLLADWAGVDQADPHAIMVFRRGLTDQNFDALIRHAEKVLAQAERAMKEREEARRQAEEAARKAEEERLAKPRRAAEAARAGQPLAERAFPLELPGVSNWPNPQMIAIPPGQFLMGAPPSEAHSGDDERPQHEVRIDYAYALGQHTVTFADWDAALAAGAKLPNPDDKGWGRGKRPVINVSWDDAQAYLAWLNEKAGLSGRPGAYRLPSEAEWEYACRAGTTTPFSFGATISTVQANYDGNYTYGNGSKGEHRQKTMPVGSFSANPFGLHDMHGNVWEWCQDCWNANYNGAPADGSAWTTGDCANRVNRGGSWRSNPRNLRSANRDWNSPSGRLNLLGFRLARTL